MWAPIAPNLSPNFTKLGLIELSSRKLVRSAVDSDNTSLPKNGLALLALRVRSSSLPSSDLNICLSKLALEKTKKRNEGREELFATVAELTDLQKFGAGGETWTLSLFYPLPLLSSRSRRLRC